MSESKEVAIREDVPLALEPVEQELKRAKVWIDSGLLPAHIKTPATAVVIVQRGRELGMPAMEALSSLYVVHGKVTCDSKTMLALAWKSGRLQSFEILEMTNDKCVIRAQRVGTPRPLEMSFTMADAHQLGVTKPTPKAPGKGRQYKSQPAVMLLWRCTAKILRVLIPDALAGLYTHEEMQLPVRVQGDDIVLDSKAIVQQEERKAVKAEGAELQDELANAFDKDEPPPGYHEVEPLDDGVLNGEAQAADAEAAGEEEITPEQKEKMAALIRAIGLSSPDFLLLKQGVGCVPDKHLTRAQAERLHSWLEKMAEPPTCPECGQQMRQRVVESTQEKFDYEAGKREKKARPPYYCTNQVNGEWCNGAIWSRTGLEPEKE